MSWALNVILYIPFQTALTGRSFNLEGFAKEMSPTPWDTSLTMASGVM